MPSPVRVILLFLFVVVLMTLGVVGLDGGAVLAQRAATRFVDEPTPEQVAFFEKKIRPVLVEHCYKCHASTAEKVRGELLLDSRAGIRQGGAGGAIIVPGRPDKSRLIQALRHTDPDTAMPPKGKLSEAIIADFEAWVRMGAPDPRDDTGASAAPKYTIDPVKARTHWAFQPPRRPSVPAVPSPSTGTSVQPIDAFVIVARQEKGLQAVGPADPRTLLRRVYFDLIGLPPTPEEVEAFLNDTSPQAWEKVVDRLLASPHFGERWGRHWLDLARYAESSGKTVNVNYPHAWRYRDYVIAAFNNDKPYDQFIREQIAGDLLPTDDPKLKAERLIATGFLAIGPKALNEFNTLQFELDVADEQIDVVTQVFLGLTIACARCHDHKFDPFTQRDYYALAGIFRSTQTCYGTIRQIQAQRPSPLLELPKDCGLPPGTPEKLSPAERERLQKQIEELNKQASGSNDFLRRLILNAQVAQIRSRLDSFDAEGEPKLLAMGVRDKPPPRGLGAGPFGPRAGPFGGGGMMGPPRANRFTGQTVIGDSPIFTRGEPDQPSAEVVPRGVPALLASRPLRIPASTSGRRQLAEWIASPDHPLTARVWVNRVWQHLFGRGLVPTPDNFGLAGQPPTHPQLLDYLAVTFVQEDRWSTKKLIKRIVLTETYRLDSRWERQNYERDPDNAYLWRMTPRRLEAECLRDAMLAVSGQLERTPPVGSPVARAGEGPTNLPRFGVGNLSLAANDPRNNHRSIYLPILRDLLPEALALFDAPDPSLIAHERPATTVPSQALFLLNNPFVLRCADTLAGQLLRSGGSDSERVRTAYLRCFSRPPTAAEIQRAEQFLADYKAQLTRERVPSYRKERQAWTALAQALLASAEFQYRR
jgi:mono/diheme cytochrome c family protein